MSEKIENWIQEQEADRSISIKQFYGRLQNAVNDLQDRLDCAKSDGVDLDDIDLNN